MSDTVEQVIEFLTPLAKNAKFIVNVAGVAIVLGEEILDILKKRGSMDQIQYIEIANAADVKYAIQRARLVKFIEGGTDNA